MRRLTIGKVKELLGKDYKGERIDRFEIPNILAVHFLLKNHLDRGVSSTSTYDYLGKNGECGGQASLRLSCADWG